MSNWKVDLVRKITFIIGDVYTLYKKAKDLAMVNER